MNTIPEPINHSLGQPVIILLELDNIFIKLLFIFNALFIFGLSLKKSLHLQTTRELRAIHLVPPSSTHPQGHAHSPPCKQIVLLPQVVPFIFSGFTFL